MGKIRKIVSWVLIVTLIIPIIVFTIPDVSAKADSNDRRNVFLRLSQGKNLSTFTKDEIDEETMRILALYITNFYNLGDMDLYSLSKNENSEDALKLFQTALEAASLDPKTAEMMVPYLLETSVKSNQMLYITEEDFKYYVSYLSLLNLYNDQGSDTFLPKYNEGIEGAESFCIHEGDEYYSVASSMVDIDNKDDDSGDWIKRNSFLAMNHSSSLYMGDLRYAKRIQIYNPYMLTIDSTTDFDGADNAWVSLYDFCDAYESDWNNYLGGNAVLQSGHIAEETKSKFRLPKGKLQIGVADLSGVSLITSDNYGEIHEKSDGSGLYLKLKWVWKEHTNAKDTLVKAYPISFPMLLGMMFTSLNTGCEIPLYTVKNEGDSNLFNCFNVTPAVSEVALNKLDYYSGKSETSLASAFFTTKEGIDYFFTKPSQDDIDNTVPFTNVDRADQLAKTCNLYVPLYIDWVGTISSIDSNARVVIPVVSGSTNPCAIHTWYTHSFVDYSFIENKGKYSNGRIMYQNYMFLTRSEDCKSMKIIDDYSDSFWAFVGGTASIGSFAFWRSGQMAILQRTTDSQLDLTAESVMKPSDEDMDLPAAFSGGYNTLFAMLGDFANTDRSNNSEIRGFNVPTNGQCSVSDGTKCYLVMKDGAVNENSKMSDIFMEATVKQYPASAKNKTIAGLYNAQVSGSLCRDIFMTYAFLYWNYEVYEDEGYDVDKEDMLLKNCYIRFFGSRDPFPEVSGNGFQFDAEAFNQSLAEDINEQESKTQGWIYYLLNPTEGFSYITTWVKNKVTAIFLGWHEDMVGGTNSNSTTGMTAYLGFSGYTTTPSIGDLEWLSSVVDGYDSIIVYILIVIILILLCYIVVGSLTLGKAVVGFFCFAFLCFLPPIMINAVVNISNEVSMSIYSKKFNYWAIAQTEQYLGQLTATASLDEDDPEYITNLIKLQQLRDENTSQAAGYAGVRLKWMAAKKSNGGAVVKTLMQRSETYNAFADTQLARMVMNAYAQGVSAESYDFTDPYSLYLYRDQLDIYKVSAYSYNLYKEFNFSGKLSGSDRFGTLKSERTVNNKYGSEVAWAASFKWDTMSPSNRWALLGSTANRGTNNGSTSVTSKDYYFVHYFSDPKFLEHETILGSGVGETEGIGQTNHDVLNANMNSVNPGSWRYSFNVNNMIELAVLPTGYNTASKNTFPSAMTLYRTSNGGSISSLTALPDIYLEFSPIMAQNRGFLFATKTYYKYGYLSNTTLATGYLLRYFHAVQESAEQYYHYLNFRDEGSSIPTDWSGTTTTHRPVTSEWSSARTTFFRDTLFGFEPSRFQYSVNYIMGCKEGEGGTVRRFSYNVKNPAQLTATRQVQGIVVLPSYEHVDNFYESFDTANPDSKLNVFTEAAAQSMLLSYYYYGLYSESPFYYFNWNIRDQLNLASDSKLDEDIEIDEEVDQSATITDYDFLTTSPLNKTEALKDLWLSDDQGYFYNNFEAAMEGYGELRDFMNLRNFFYYVVPSMRWGTELVREWDRTYGCTYDTNKSSVKLDSDGSIKFNGMLLQNADGSWAKMESSSPYKTRIEAIMCSDTYTKEVKYQVWHDINVIRLYYCYSAWLDAMLDCDYAKEETIQVLGKDFTVTEPLNPYTYCVLDKNGEIIEGRPMVFSRSEMKYYGLNYNDLTTVEKKCITLQDNVYKETLDLMNYYTFSDEVLVQAYSLIQLFEFNKIFSQDGMFEENYILYPQGYELKAFSYDAYLRMILANATNTSVMAEANAEDGNSIYQRIAKKTSIFFGVFLILNDILAVYCVPLLKVAFIAIIFFISLALIMSSAVRLELNMLTVILRSLMQPLGCFLLINIGFAFLVSLFIGSGADQVVNSQATIQLGDPTMTLIAMLIINILVTVLYFKLTKKCFADLKKYVTTLFSSIGTTVGGAATAFVGAFGAATAAGALAGSWGKSSNEKDRWIRGKKDGEGDGSGLKSTSPEQRGAANTTPEPGGSKSKASDTAPGTSTTNADTNAAAQNKYDAKINEAKAKSEGSGTSTESSGGGKGGTKKGAHATSATFKKNGAMSNSGHASESGESKKSSKLDKMAEDVKRKGKKKPSKSERDAERFKANGGADAKRKEQDKANHKKYLSSKQQRELRNARKASKQGKHNKTSSSKKGSATQSKPIGGNKVALNAAKSKNNLSKLGSNVSKASTPKPVSAGEKASKEQTAKANKGKLTKRGEAVKAKRKEASKEDAEKKKIKEPVFGGNRFETNKDGSSNSPIGSDSSANRKSLKQKFKKAKSALGDFNEELARKAHNARVVGRAITKPIRVANTAVRATAAGVGAAANSLSKSVQAGLRTNNINLNDGNKSNS